MISGGGVLAHQGGWDELLVALSPVLVFALFLRAALNRARRRELEGGDEAR